MRFFGLNPTRARSAPGPLGLDIGASALRWAQRLPGRPARLERTALSLSLPPSPERLSQDIRAGWRQLDTGVTEVALALPACSVCYRVLSLPQLPEHQLEALLGAQAGLWLSQPAAAISFDFQALPAHPQAEASDQTAMLLCATPLATVQAFVAPVQQAGLKVVRLDVDCFALMAASAHLTPWHAARFGRRVLLHATEHEAVCHVFQPGASVPDQAPTRFALPPCATEAEELQSVRQRIESLDPEAALLSGETRQLRRIERGLRLTLRAPALIVPLWAGLSAEETPTAGLNADDAGAWALACALAWAPSP